ncbi:hypothetical protein BDV96DRAFT_356207 [Lophiotrema nucula]|uniref:Tim44-like domain-containing protein n=1 Tax=Lophiotrema nucula TaxID=690887 RepID=A0A6A5YHZ7_9PLEO|nr:hypothetical protein BDV96DRAFT_356207 [Lophiotrema nucula]
MSTHLPTRALRQCYRRGLLDPPAVRAFSSTPSRSKKQGVTDPSLARKALKDQQKQKAPLSLQQEAIEKGEALRDEMGILPGTFIRLPWRECWRRIPLKERVPYEWKWLRTRLADTFQRIMYKWWSGIKPRPDMSRSGLVHTAKQMHLDIYEAFADRNLKLISEVCLGSLSSHFAQRLDQIPKDTELEWTRNGFLGEGDRLNPLSWITLGGPRIVSNRAVQLSIPGLERTGMRQVVVRLPTSQTLKTTRKSSPPSQRASRRKLVWTPDGKQPEAPAVIDAPSGVSTFEDNVVEYLVLQKRIVSGVPEEWRVWGFAEPTDTARIAKDKELSQHLRDYQSAGSSLT